MRTNIVKIHRWNSSYRNGKGRWLTQVIQLGEQEGEPGDAIEFGGTELAALGFQLCAAVNHHACRTQHALDEQSGYRVVALRSGNRIERILYDPNFGQLDIYINEGLLPKEALAQVITHPGGEDAEDENVQPDSKL